MTRALIFDCFGVFFTDPVFTYMRDQATPTKKAKLLHELDKQAAYGELSKAEFVRQASALLEIEPAEAEDQFFVSHDRNQELIDLAQTLRKHYRVGLLSNIGGDMMDGFFTPAERQALFDAVILSGNVKVAKPDPAIFEMMLNELGMQHAEVVFVDDSENHIRGARELGITSIQFESNSQVMSELSKLGVRL